MFTKSRDSQTCSHKMHIMNCQDLYNFKSNHHKSWNFRKSSVFSSLLCDVTKQFIHQLKQYQMIRENFLLKAFIHGFTESEQGKSGEIKCFVLAVNRDKIQIIWRKSFQSNLIKNKHVCTGKLWLFNNLIHINITFNNREMNKSLKSLKQLTQVNIFIMIGLNEQRRLKVEKFWVC